MWLGKFVPEDLLFKKKDFAIWVKLQSVTNMTLGSNLTLDCGVLFFYFSWRLITLQ